MPDPDEAGMVSARMAGAPARHHRDFRAVPVGTDHDLDVRVAVEARQPTGRGGDQPVERLGDDGGLATVDEMLWPSGSLPCSKQPVAGLGEIERAVQVDPHCVAGAHVDIGSASATIFAGPTRICG